MVEHPLIEAHEVLAPAEKDGQEGGNEYPPAFGPFDHDETEYEEEDDDGTKVYGARGKGLVAPVERHSVLTEIFVAGTLVADGLHAAATAGSGYQKGVGLADAVAPAEGIVDVEAVIVGVIDQWVFGSIKVLRGDGDFAAATHGVLHILLVDHKVACVAKDGQERTNHKYTHREEQTGEVFVL